MYAAGDEHREMRERIPSRLRAVSIEPNTGLDLTNGESMTWAKTKSGMLNPLSHPDAPESDNLNFQVFYTAKAFCQTNKENAYYQMGATEGKDERDKSSQSP